jgi:hypothetical protein
MLRETAENKIIAQLNYYCALVLIFSAIALFFIGIKFLVQAKK